MKIINTVYISGGIAGLNPKEVIEYFNTLELRLQELGLETLSPIRGKKLDTEVAQKYEPNEIVTRDENDIKHSDLMIAFPSEKSIGTHMEIYLARKVCDIPVIVVTTNPHIANHYWIRHFASKIVPSMDEVIEYLKEWYL